MPFTFRVINGRITGQQETDALGGLSTLLPYREGQGNNSGDPNETDGIA